MNVNYYETTMLIFSCNLIHKQAGRDQAFARLLKNKKQDNFV